LDAWGRGACRLMWLVWDIWDFAANAAQSLFAIGATAIAVVAYASRLHPAVRWPASELAIVLCIAAACFASWNFAERHFDKTQELRDAQRDLVRWKDASRKRAEQRDRYQMLAQRQMTLAQQRALKIIRIQGIVDDYEKDLAAGDAGACASDEPYARSMRKITIHRPATAEAAAP